MNDTTISAIASYGARYRQEYLGPYRVEALTSNWWLALDFFLAHACFQGRRDDISARVYQEIVQVLQEYFAADSRTVNYQRLRQQDWAPIRQQLETSIGKGKVGKARDTEMVLSTLTYIEHLPDLNIVGYSIERIRQGQIDKHYTQMQAAQSKGGIVQVGPKIAAFYLRDVVSLYSLDELVTGDSAFFLQPIDVWVEKTVRKLRVVDEKADHSAIRGAIVAVCEARGISPILFNQGAWYVGYHAFDLLFDRLMAENSGQ